jgi:leader peptidase (prepilin peptidase)/N-methyltransferase
MGGVAAARGQYISGAIRFTAVRAGAMWSLTAPGFDSPFAALAAIPVVAVAAMLAGAFCMRFVGAYVHALRHAPDGPAPCLRTALCFAVRGAGAGVGGRGGMMGTGTSTGEHKASAAACVARLAAHATVAFFAVTLFLHLGFTVRFLGVAAACCMLVALALIDARTGLLPDALTLPLLWLGLLLAWAGQGVPLHDAVAGAAVGYGGLWALFWVFKWRRGYEGMGYGDFKLLAALGGWFGVAALAWILLSACATAIVFAMMHQRTYRPTGGYPFGPFLALGAIGAFALASAVHLRFW